MKNFRFPGSSLSTFVFAVLILISGLPARSSGQIVTVGAAAGSPGTQVDLAIQFSPGFAGVSTLQFDLAFPSTLAPVSTTPGVAALYAGKSASASIASGTMRILLFGLNQSFIGSGPIAVVRFHIASDVQASVMPVSITNVIASDNEAKSIAAASANGSITVHGAAGPGSPAISNVMVTGISANSAIIAWTTSVPADKQVEYGATAAYGNQTAVASDGSTSHVQMLTGLSPQTQYHYRVKSRDGNGLTALSDDYSFATASDSATFSISDVGSSGVTGTSAIIRWTTSRPADSQVEYGTTLSLGNWTARDSQAVTEHSLMLTGLKPGTLYHYRVYSQDGSSNENSTGDYTFMTLDEGITLFYPRLLVHANASAGEGDQEFIGMAIANLENRRATLRFSAYNASGTLIMRQGITNPAVRELDPGKQLPLLDHELFGASLSGPDALGWVKIESTVNKVAGFFMKFNGGLTELDGAGFSINPVTSFLFSEIRSRGFTKVNIGNPNPDSVTLTLNLTGADGLVLATTSRVIPSYGALIADLFGEIFPSRAPDSGAYVKVSSSLGVLPYELLGSPAQDFDNLLGQATDQGSRSLFCPQYIVGGMWHSTVSIVNLDPTDGLVTVRLFGNDAAQIGATRVMPIQAFGKILIDGADFFEAARADAGPVSQGYLEITGSGMRLAGSVVFGDRDRGTFSTALPLSGTVDQSVVYGHVASDDMYYTGLALVNPSTQDAQVTVELHDADGTLAHTAALTISAGCRISRLLTEIFPEIAGQQRLSGYFKVNSDIGIASFAVFGTHNLSLLSAIPPQVLR